MSHSRALRPATAVGATIAFLLAASPAAAQEGLDKGDTAWVLASSALVLLMTPALAFFYGGLVRRKNVLSILMQCFLCLSLMTVLWVLFGFSLAFAPDAMGGIVGGGDFFFLRGVTFEPWGSYTIPGQLFMVFQAMFAIITPALMVGAFAERMKFSAICLFMGLWLLLVYCPVAHWVWGGASGFFGLGTGGALDFAGGTVVHINAGVSALVAALMLGRRQGYPSATSPPHNLPFAVLGTGLLWFGWFGFNAGSALAANAQAVNAFVTTHVATASAALVWGVLDWVRHKRPTLLGVITGAVAGLVAITPACGTVSPLGALGVGGGASLFAYFAVVKLKNWLGYDDSLDVFGVHGVAGIWGAIATGLWATDASPNNTVNGLFYGNPAQVLIQLKAVAFTVIWAAGISFLLLKLIDLVIGLRVGEHEERVGLDLTEHREVAYTLVD